MSAILVMSRAEATRCVARIRVHLEAAAHDLLDLRAREGWVALGYRSWEACVRGEFGHHHTTLFRQVQTEERRVQLQPLTTTLDLSEVPDSHFRPLGGLAPAEAAAVL